MSTLSIPSALIAAPVALRRPAPKKLRIFAFELRNELVKLMRTPGFLLPALGFPWAFYLFFGLALPMPSAGPVTMSGYLLGTYGVFSVLGVSLFALGADVAIERGRGWTTARRATPASGPIHILARLGVAAILGGISVLGLMILGGAFGGVRLPTLGWASLFAILVGCAIPFGALGLALGQVLSAEAAPGVTNLIYLPLSFLSGLWIPVQVLPGALQSLAAWLPPFHAARLSLRILGVGAETSPWPSVAHLAGLTAICFAVAAWGIRRQGGAK